MMKYIKNGLTNFKAVYKQSKIIGLWQSKKYEKLAKAFQKKQSYQSFKINDYPFIYFLLNEKDKQAISTLLSKVSYKQDILNDQNNPMSINPISFAFLEGDNQIVEILQKYGANLAKPNSSGQNILHLAAIYKRQQSFKKGVTLSVDYNAQDQYGNTPFHYAARAGSPEMTSTMINAKAKKIQNKIHQFPVHMAIQSGNMQTFDLLKSDVTGNYLKYHPIHSASRSGNIQMVRIVLKAKPASLNFKDYNGLAPLHHAVMIEDIAIANLLINEPGILINEADNYGNTALHLAMMNSNIELCNMLIQKNANLDIQNQDFLSPVDYGITNKNRQIYSLLLKWKNKSKKISEWSSPKY